MVADDISAAARSERIVQLDQRYIAGKRCGYVDGRVRGWIEMAAILLAGGALGGLLWAVVGR